MNRLIKAYHSESNRDYAFLYVNGKGYIANDHGECIEQFLKDYNITSKDVDGYKELLNKKVVFGHMVGNEIYLMTSLIYNMSIDECTKAVKQIYPNYVIFDDDNPKFDNDENIYYDKLAFKIKRLIKHSSVPSSRDFYDNPWDYDFIDIGLQIVNVSDIVGMSSGRNDEYNDDWTPKDPEDSRWLYQKKLVESGGEMEPIPLNKLPESIAKKYNTSRNAFISAGDGNHRISVAKVLGLQTVKANVSVMVPKYQGINESWEEYAKDDITKLNELNNQYKELQKGFNKVQDDAWETGDKTEYNKLLQQMNELGNQISELDRLLIEDEKEYKRRMINEL